MARNATGEVIEREGKRGTSFVLRFRAHGKRQFVTIGNSADGWTRAKAELELQNVMADVRRGIWQPPAPPPVAVAPTDPTFHEFASAWLAGKKPELRPLTAIAYEGELTLHLLPFFARHRLSEITVQEIDRYRQAKVSENEVRAAAIKAGRPLVDADGRILRPLAPRTINKTITRLGQILEVAIEYDHIDRNPARGKRRRLKVTAVASSHLDRVDHITALLDAAGELDLLAPRQRRHIARRAIVATLMFGGVRISELCNLRWRHVDLAAGRMRVGEAKTDAGLRTVDLLPALRDELSAWKARAPRCSSNDYVFATRTGGRPSKDNLRNRAIYGAMRRADQALEDADLAPLPDRLTPHGLRHTCTSILIALGKDPRYVMEQIGHTDPSFTLRLYTHAMRRENSELERLKALVDGVEWEQTGANPDLSDAPMAETPDPENAKSLR
jgi:integrase